MIFVTVGTVHFPFKRFAELVELLQHKNVRKEKIVFQHGYTPVKKHLENIEYFDFIEPTIFLNYIKRSRLIITQGGPATIFQSIYAKKKPWVLPRVQKFHEHVNDHQLLFCEMMEKKGLVQILNLNDIEKPIKTGSPSIKTPHQDLKSRSKIINKLNEIVESI